MSIKFSGLYDSIFSDAAATENRLDSPLLSKYDGCGKLLENKSLTLESRCTCGTGFHMAVLGDLE